MTDRRNTRARRFGLARAFASGVSLLIIAATLLAAVAPGHPVSARVAQHLELPPLQEVAPAATAATAATSAPTPSAMPAGTAVPAGTPPPAPAIQVSLSARAAFAVDLTHGVELYSQNADTPLPPASTTKIVTALVVMNLLPPDDQVTIQAQDTVDPTVYSNMSLQAGDVLTVRDLLAGMFLNSAGDAAEALARTAGAKLPAAPGTTPTAAFVAEMNRTAKQLGMRNSNFLDPDGRDDPGHVSTARDLLIATQALFTYPLLEQLVGEATEKVQVRGPAARTITLVNTNELLGIPGVHGVKTGTTDEAGQCLVLAIWKGGSRVVTVVLGSTDRYADTRALLAALDGQFRWLRLGRDGDIPELNATLKQQGLSFGVVEPELLTAGQASDLHYDLELKPQPATGWTPQGTVTFTAGGVPILRLPVYHGDPANGQP